MLRLKRAAANQIAVTLTEKQTIDTYYPLWRFVSNERPDEEDLVQLNAEHSSQRYDLFDITLPNDVNLRLGQGMYYVYQAENPLDTDYESMVLLEKGKYLVHE